MDEIEEENQREFDSVIPLHIKRLAKDQSSVPETKKSLSFGDARVSVSPSNAAATAEVPSKIAPSAIVSPIAIGVLGPSPILVPVFVPTRPQNLGIRALRSLSGSPMFTSTPFHKAKTHEAHSKLSPPDS